MTSGPRLAATLLALVLGATAARGDISGFVRVADSGTPGTPIPGARVHIRADSSVVAVTGADGSFTLAANPAGPVELDGLDPLQPGRGRQLPDRRRAGEQRRQRRRHPARRPARGQSELPAAYGGHLRQLPPLGLSVVVRLEPLGRRAQRVGARPVLRHRHSGRRRGLRLPQYARRRRDGLLRHLPRADGGRLQSRPYDARRGERRRGARGRELRGLPPDGLGRRREPRRPALPRQVHLPLPQRPLGTDVELRLGSAGRRHLQRHEGRRIRRFTAPRCSARPAISTSTPKPGRRARTPTGSGRPRRSRRPAPASATARTATCRTRPTTPRSASSSPTPRTARPRTAASTSSSARRPTCCRTTSR